MRVRALLVLPILVSAFGLAAEGAPAATLWTTSAHASRVTVGATAVVTGSNFTLTSGTAVIDTCADSSINLTLTQNNDTAVRFAATGGSFNSCSPFPIIGTYTTAWGYTTSGTGFTSGTQTCWPNSTLDVMNFHMASGQYTGSTVTNGILYCESTAAGAPIEIRFASAGPITGPLTGNGRLDVSYVFTGSAASWSLTN